MKRILVVDDERNMRDLLRIIFEKDGFAVDTASTGGEALRLLDTNRLFDVIVSDIRLPDIDGVRLLRCVRTHPEPTPVVFITAYGTIELAVQAMKQGAADFIAKPFKKEFIRHVVQRVLHETEDERRAEAFTEQGWSPVAESPAMQDLMQKVRVVAGASSSVLLVGESGVGKEVIARAIQHAGAPKRPFLTISCPAVPATLIESELFGYGKGAFTGATRAYPGKLRQADGGTLLLDEIGDLPLDLQPKLLRFLEEQSFQPLGENREVHVKTRLVSATNRDLEALVREGTFREDLYYRINTITLEIPPLRERFEDILPMARHFLKRLAARHGREPKSLSSGAERALLRHDWPGNARELRNVMEHAFVFAAGDTVVLHDLPPKLQDVGPPRAAFPRHRRENLPRNAAEHEDMEARSAPAGMNDSNGNKLDAVERSMLLEALEHNEWNVTAAARALGVSRNVVRYRMRKYGIASSGGGAR
ncbi:MAG: sigma-54-dependent transcriptional regulator [Spirochaetaceae bacterium]